MRVCVCVCDSFTRLVPRVFSPLSQSAFVLHNETGNIWSHFVPGCIFAWYLYEAVIHAMAPHHHVTVTDAAAAVVYLCGATAYHFMSTIAHTFAQHSFFIRELCYRLDYAAIAMYGYCCGVAVTHFSTPEAVVPPWAFPYVTPVLVAGCVLCCWLASVSRRWGPWRYAFRTVLFLAYWLVCNVGLLARLAGVPAGLPPLVPAWRHHMIVFFFAAVVNATKFPESIWPGRFDVVGHSHQLFHMLSSWGTYLQLLALEQDQDALAHAATSLASQREPWSMAWLTVATFIATLAVVWCDHRVAMRLHEQALHAKAA